MAKIIPISEHFQHFLAEMQESFWGDLYGQTRQAWQRFFELQSERQRDRFSGAGRYARRRGQRRVYRKGYYERDFVTRFGTIRLRIARTREKSFLPVGLQRFQRRAEEVSLLIREAFLRGISTRQVGRVTGLISILSVFPDGKSVEVGLVGKEGFVGCPLIAGFRTAPTRAIAQIDATAFRVDRETLMSILRQCPGLERQLQQFSQIMAMQVTQIAACNRLHEVDERLARWLLMSQDRIGGDAVPLTQDFLAHMLGTRRASVTVAAPLGPNRNAAHTTTGKVRNATGRCWTEAGCKPPNIRSAVAKAPTPTSVASAIRSCGTATRFVTHSISAGATRSAPLESPSHHVSQIGPKSDHRARPLISRVATPMVAPTRGASMAAKRAKPSTSCGRSNALRPPAQRRTR